jgi:hypothetical protein
MNQQYRAIIGVGIIFLALFGEKIYNNFSSVIKNSQNNAIVVEEKPSDDIIEKTKAVSSLITDKNDRLYLSLLNDQFASRLDKYLGANITSQQLVDLYANSVKEQFKDSLAGKYTGLSDEMKKLLEGIMGDEDHILSKDEIDSLKQCLVGLSWNLSR